MYGMRPVSVVLGDECLDPYVLSHRLGCQLAGFEHVFHTDKQTEDDLGCNKMSWLTHHEDRNASTAKDERREIRSKRKSDRHLSEHEVDEASDASEAAEPSEQRSYNSDGDCVADGES